MLSFISLVSTEILLYTTTGELMQRFYVYICVWKKAFFPCLLRHKHKLHQMHLMSLLY